MPDEEQNPPVLDETPVAVAYYEKSGESDQCAVYLVGDPEVGKAFFVPIGMRVSESPTHVTVPQWFLNQFPYVLE